MRFSPLFHTLRLVAEHFAAKPALPDEPPADGTEWPCKFHVGAHVHIDEATHHPHAGEVAVVRHLEQVLGEQCNCLAHLVAEDGSDIQPNVLEMHLTPLASPETEVCA